MWLQTFPEFGNLTEVLCLGKTKTCRDSKTTVRHSSAQQVWCKAMSIYLSYVIAALAEIGGCFAFWSWYHSGKSAWWLAPGMVSLALFAYILALVPSEAAGRTFAAYGGVYILASVFWLWIVESRAPDRWDLTGAGVSLIGAAIILFGPRS